MPATKEMPSTLKRSPKKAQETWAKTHDSAVESYGEGERAHRTAMASLKHSYEKVGDHWEAKDAKGPSDARSAGRSPRRSGATAGGVDASASKEHLYSVAQRLGVKGRSRMSKTQLVAAIDQANQRRTRQARG